MSMSNLSRPLGGSYEEQYGFDYHPDQELAQINAEIAAQRAAEQAATQDVLAWSTLEYGRKDFTGAHVPPPLHGTRDGGLDLTGWFFFAKAPQPTGYKFNDATMQRTNGSNLHYCDCDFSGADLTGSEFRGAIFENCTFNEQTKLDGAGLTLVKFINSPTAELASYKGAEFGAAAFEPDPHGNKDREIGISKPEGVVLVSDAPKGPQYGVDLYS